MYWHCLAVRLVLVPVAYQGIYRTRNTVYSITSFVPSVPGSPGVRAKLDCTSTQSTVVLHVQTPPHHKNGNLSARLTHDACSRSILGPFTAPPFHSFVQCCSQWWFIREPRGYTENGGN